MEEKIKKKFFEYNKEKIKYIETIESNNLVYKITTISSKVFIFKFDNNLKSIINTNEKRILRKKYEKQKNLFFIGNNFIITKFIRNKILPKNKTFEKNNIFFIIETIANFNNLEKQKSKELHLLTIIKKNEKKNKRKNLFKFRKGQK